MSPVMSNTYTPVKNSIFVAEDGSSLTVFLDSTQSGLSRDRKDLIRKLEKGGAELKFSPNDAEIILAEEGGVHFASNFPHKVVLDVEWVHASVRQGACYTEHQDWGGYRVSPDQELSGGTLATPRHTPNPTTGPTDPLMFNGAPQAQIPAHTSIHIPQFSGSAAAMPFGSQLAPLFQQLVGSAYTPQIPTSTPQVAQQLQYPTQPQPPAPSWTATPAVLLQGLQMAVPVALQQAILNHMISLSPNNPISSQLSLLVGLIAEQHVPSGSAASSLPQPNAYSSTSAPNSSLPSTSRSQRDTSAGVTSPEPKPAGPPRSKHRERAKSPSLPKASVRSASASIPLKRKSREEAPAERTKQHRVSQPDAHTKKTIRASIKSQTRDRPPPASSSRRGLFVDRNDRPVPFFVQSGAKWRNDAVNAIRKHGGVVVAEISEATYAIIYPNVEHSLERLREAIMFGKKAVTSKFVHDSCECDELVDISDSRYSLDGRQLRDRRGREVVANIAELQAEFKQEKRKSVKTRVRTTTDAVVRKPPSTSTKRAQQEGEEEEDDDEQEVLDAVGQPSSTERSSSPVPPTVAKLWVAGRNLFTEEEITYCREYCDRLLKTNPTMSMSELSSKMADRMPQHPAPSWAYKIAKLGLDSMRQQGTPTSRRAERRSTQTPTTKEPQPVTPESSQAQQPNSPVAEEQFPPYYHEDCAIILSFMHELSKDEFKTEDDATSWQRLTSQHVCRSAESWEEFWDKYHKHIQPLI